MNNKGSKTNLQQIPKLGLFTQKTPDVAAATASYYINFL